MSVQGTNLEDLPNEPEPQELPVQEEDTTGQQQAAAEDDDEDGIVEAVRVGEQKMVPLSELIALRKERKTLREQLAQAAPAIQRAQQVDRQLQEISPYVEAIRQNPGLIDAVKAGTHATPAHAAQPQDDTDAKDTAEDFGFYTTDGQLDIARARRVLDRATAAAEKKLQGQIAPLRQQTADTAAREMRQRVATMRDKAGQPVASEESLNEMFGLLPSELVANPQVAFVVALAAAGMDKYAGRTPRVAQAPAAAPTYREPIYTESTGRRAPAGPSEELLQMGAKVGLAAKDLTTTYRTTRNGSVALE